MLYGPYTGRDFQSWQSKQYQFQDFDNILFQGVDAHELAGLNTRLLLAGQPDKILPALSASTQKPIWQKTILGSDGTPRFVLMEFGQ